MKHFQKTIEQFLADHNISSDVGLNDNQVEESRKKSGTNEFTKTKPVPLTKKIIQSLQEPMIFILLISSFITISINIIKYLKGGQAEFTDSIAILAAILLSSGIAIIMEGKSEKAFEALNNINEEIKIKVVRNGSINEIVKKDIVVGDVIKVETGDKIPADGRLISSIQLKVDESMLTGESKSVSKDAKAVIHDANTSLAERKNMLYSGTFIVSGRGTMIVTSIGDNTEMGEIASKLKETIESTTPLQEKLKKLAKTISIVGSSAAGVIFLFQLLKLYISNTLSFDSVQNAFMTSIALIVASVPEGLPTIVAITLAINILKMAKNNALVKKMIACETIGCTNIICSDKTGTLTKNQMNVIEIWNNGILTPPDKLKSGYITDNFILNSTAYIEKENGGIKFIGNPTECSLLVAYEKSSEKTNDYKTIRKLLKPVYVYPFSSEKKYMTTVIKDNNYMVYTKGSPEIIFDFCTKIIIDNKIVDLNEHQKSKIEKQISMLQSEAKRILAFSHKEIAASIDWAHEENIAEFNMIFDGFVSIADPMREDVYDAVQKCRNAGIDLKILTGDNIVTASAIAKQLDILDETSITLEAKDIDEMSDNELTEKIDNITVIARSKPLTKMRVVNILKKRGNVVAVTGDGINDAPALKNADVGISMGIAGTEVSKEASDIVLLDDSFSTIVNAVEWGRGIYENFQRFIQFQLTVNVVAVAIVFLSEVLGFKLPFTTLQLLWVNIIMDGPPALSLGLESLRDNLMEQKPIKRDSSIIDRSMFFRIVSNGFFMIGMLLILMFKNVLGGNVEQQSTIFFTSFVMFQLFNAFNSRELTNESMLKNITKNKIMLLTIGITFIIQILITQFGGTVFKTVPLDFSIWIKVILYSLTVIVFSELMKVLSKMYKLIAS